MKLLTLGIINVNIASALAYSQLSPHHHIKSLCFLNYMYTKKELLFRNSFAVRTGLELALRASLTRGRVYFLSRVQVCAIDKLYV